MAFDYFSLVFLIFIDIATFPIFIIDYYSKINGKAVKVVFSSPSVVIMIFIGVEMFKTNTAIVVEIAKVVDEIAAIVVEIINLLVHVNVLVKS